MGPFLTALSAAAPIIGAGIDWLTGRQASADNANMQREFAQNGIRWKVEDAKAAGIHPLYALGANTVSFQPSAIGTNFAGAGQDFSRAIDATRTAEERGDARIAALQLENAALQNDFLRTQIAGSKAALLRQVGPPIPTMGSEGPVPVGPPTANQPIYTPIGVIPANPRASPAQDVENRYGDVMQEVLGTWQFGADIAQMIPDWWRQNNPYFRTPPGGVGYWVRSRPSQWRW